MATVIRKAAWASNTPTNGWTEDLRWYAAAIGRMKALTTDLDAYRPLALRATQLLGLPNPTAAQAAELRSLQGRLAPIITRWNDPLSLGYQAQVHATFLAATAWPSFKRQRVLWRECAHGNWFFLPWHRAYLLEFEAVAREHIKKLGGPHETWALPYWNSSDYRSIPNSATLPRPTRDPSVPAGVTVAGLQAAAGQRPANPLYEPSRVGPPVPPTPASFQDWPDASEALQRAHYANAQGANLVSFAGGYLEDLTQFHSSREAGMVDLQPHGGGHTEVGGLMAAFRTAGLDPLFWMHHANVDRLWETYARDLGHGYPFPDGRPASGLAAEAYDSWAERQFRFLRPDGIVGEWTAPEVLDTTALGYRYDTTAPPRFNRIPRPPAGADVNPFGLDQPDFTPIAAASDVSVAERTTVVIGDQGGGHDLVAEGQRWNLRFDGLRCERPAVTSYALSLGGSEGGNDDARPAGSLTLFGVFEASLPADGSPGSSRLFDVTEIVNAIPGFDPLAARLTLDPLDPERDVSEVGLRIERISLEVG